MEDSSLSTVTGSVSSSRLRVHACVLHTQSPGKGQCVDRDPCVSPDAHGHTRAHSCTEVDLRKPMVAHPTPTACVRWFSPSSALRLLNSTAGGTAAGLSAGLTSCLDVCLPGGPAPGARMMRVEGLAGSGDWTQTHALGIRGDFTPTQSSPWPRNHSHPGADTESHALGTPHSLEGPPLPQVLQVGPSRHSI